MANFKLKFIGKRGNAIEPLTCKVLFTSKGHKIEDGEESPILSTCVSVAELESWVKLRKAELDGILTKAKQRFKK